MKNLLDIYFEKTRGFYPFFKYCPKQKRDYYLKKRAYNILGYDYDWQNPKTLNEKIRWLIFNEKLDLKTKLTDKILVKQYVANKLGKHHSAELYGTYNNFEEIDFSVLPEEFALKANCGWRMNILIKNKEFIYNNREKIKQATKKWLSTNYEDFSLEPQYRNIKRKLLIERLRKANKQSYRTDIQVYCFNGIPVYFEIPFFIENVPHFQFYNQEWELQNFTHTSKFIERQMFEKPDKLEEIICICKILSSEFAFVRIDISFDEEDLHVVEMTFTPCSAIIPFKEKKIDLKLGEMILLPNK